MIVLPNPVSQETLDEMQMLQTVGSIGVKLHEMKLVLDESEAKAQEMLGEEHQLLAQADALLTCARPLANPWVVFESNSGDAPKDTMDKPTDTQDMVEDAQETQIYDIDNLNYQMEGFNAKDTMDFNMEMLQETQYDDTSRMEEPTESEAVDMNTMELNAHDVDTDKMEVLTPDKKVEEEHDVCSIHDSEAISPTVLEESPCKDYDLPDKTDKPMASSDAKAPKAQKLALQAACSPKMKAKAKAKAKGKKVPEKNEPKTPKENAKVNNGKTKRQAAEAGEQVIPKKKKTRTGGSDPEVPAPKPPAGEALTTAAPKEIQSKDKADTGKTKNKKPKIDKVEKKPKDTKKTMSKKNNTDKAKDKANKDKAKTGKSKKKEEKKLETEEDIKKKLHSATWLKLSCYDVS
jgi:hypothetical protein